MSWKKLKIEGDAPEAHAASHQDAGSDEISVAGLSGLLADEQNAGKIKAKTVNDSAIADDKILVYKSGTDTIVYEAKPATGAPDTCSFVTINAEASLSNETQHVNIAEADKHTPKAHAASHKSGGGDVINLDEFGDPTGNIQFNKKQGLQLAVHVTSNLASLPTPVDGQIALNTASGDDHPYIYIA